jgi:hypothetical protein
VSLSDGNASGGSATVSATVDPHVNDAPTAAPSNAVTTDEDSASAAATIGASDLDGDTLNYTVKSGSEPSKGTVSFSGDSFVYTPTTNANGPDSFTILVSDGQGGEAEQAVSVTINAVNDAPVPGAPAKLGGIGVNSGAHLITQAALLVNASDVDGPTIKAIDLQIAKGAGTLVDNHDGTWSYTPKINDDTQVDFAFQVTDGIAAPVAASATLDIESAQANPEIGSPANDSYTAVTGNSVYEGGLGVDSIAFNFKLTDAIVSYSGNQIIIDGPTSHTVVTGMEIFKFTDGTVNNADTDRLVDDLFYYSHNHDVWLAGADAEEHYHGFGWKEARDPDAFFSTSTYLSLNPAVKASGVDPLVQFDQAGWKTGGDPSVAFDTSAYLNANPDVKAAGMDPLAHYLRHGQEEGRQPIAPSEIIAKNDFDYVYYLKNNPDVAAAHVDPLQHFETFGWKEGRNPNALFDTKGYLDAYADVKAAGVNPLDHYNAIGWTEGRDPSAGFDTSDYLNAYADVKAAGIDPLGHFLASGIHEGRSAFADGHFG